MKKLVAALVGIPATLLAIGWLGLRVKPKSFPACPEPTSLLNTVELPADLPIPVLRYYKTIIGDRVPVIESAVITGRASLRFFGVRFPSPFRFTYLAGQGCRHYIEATIFGYPLMKVNEYYLDGNCSNVVIPNILPMSWSSPVHQVRHSRCGHCSATVC